MGRQLPIDLVGQGKGKVINVTRKRGHISTGTCGESTELPATYALLLKNKQEASKERARTAELTTAPHLPHCFTCCRIIVLIVHVRKVSST